MSFTFLTWRLRGMALLLSGVLIAGLMSFVGPSTQVSPAYASTPTATCAAPGTTSGGVAQGGIEVYPSHGKVFYIDSGQGQNVDAAYAGYQVKNVSGSSKVLWAQVDTFTGGVVRLANPRDAYFRIGDVANNAVAPAYFLMMAGVSTTRAQSHVVRVFENDPRLGGTELYSCTYTFVSVKETIKAAANKVEGVTPDYSATRIGGELVVTVRGRTGTIGSGTSSPDGQVLWFTPAARSSWPSSSLVLTSTQISFASNGYGGNQNTSSHTNRLVFLNPLSAQSSGGLVASGNPKSFYYEAVYRFRIAGPVPGAIQAVPIAQISSGTQIKHTDVTTVTSQAGSELSVSAPVSVDVAKSANPEVVVDGSNREIRYTVTLSNSGSSAVSLDRLVDEAAAGLTLKANTAEINGVPTTPFVQGSVHTFPGPISVPAATGGTAGTTTVTYTMLSSCATGDTINFTNTAYGLVGDVVVGKSASMLSGVTISGSCPAATSNLLVTDNDQPLQPSAQTQPASVVGLDTATLNGSVDPNGTAGLPITFVYGTHPNLVGGTTVSLTDSTSAADYYAVRQDITGLSSGTGYYFRVTIGDAVGDILSFVTTEVAGTPTVVTNQVTNISAITASNWTATLNGTVDPNQVATTPSFTYGLTGGSGAENSCTNAVYSTTVVVREDTTDNGSFDTDVTLTGAFPVEVSWEVENLAAGKFYCVKARATRTDTNAVIEAFPVLFRTASMTAQTINGFSAPSLDAVGQTATLSATPTSGLTPIFTSNTPDVCTVSGTTVTIVGGGVCSLSADQPGNTSFYAAPTVTVTFTIETFSVTYNLSGGSGSAPQDGASPYGKGAQVTVISSTPSRSGHSFTGWNTVQNGVGGTSYAAADNFTITSNVMLYAQWQVATTYSITYNANGGTGAPSSSDHPQNTSVGLSSVIPTRTGFRFDGWTQNLNGSGTKYQSGATFALGGSNAVLYAQWVQQFSLAYDPNGADSGGVPSTSTQDTGTSVTPPGNTGNLTRTGFRFDGWTTSPNTGSAATSVPVSANTTVYARWIGTVTYDDNDATTTTVPAATDYLASETVTVQAQGALARTGYTFAGWNTAANGSGTRYSPAATFAMPGNTTLFAEWTSGVTYDANSADAGSVPSDATAYRPGQSITVLPNSGNLTRNNFVFGGWNTAANGNGTNYQPGANRSNTGSVTLFARWLDEVTITYDGNDSTGGSAPASESRGSGQTATVAANPGNLSRTGHTFLGWSLVRNGGPVLTPGSGTFIPTGNTTLYASWQVIVSGNNSGGGTPPATNPTPTVQPNQGSAPLRPRVIPPSRITPVTPPVVTPPPITQAPTTPAPAPEQRVLPSLPGLRNLGDLPGANPPGNSGGSSPGNGSSAFGAQATVDLGVPSAPAGSPGQSAAPVSSGSAGRRTVAELGRESLSGFAPGVSTSIEILGARTAARFVVSDATSVDQFTLIRAIEASVPAQSADFFAIDSVQSVSAPIVTRAWNADERRGITDFFAGAGLGAPRSLADLDLADYEQWLLVSARSSTYAPGTEVYLTLTSEPLVLASAVVGRDGTAVLSGTLPVEFLSAGEHRVRLVGIRALDGVSVDDEGAIQLAPGLLEEIERFDLGTQATIAVVGANPEGANHVALRVIPLIQVAPWWTLWILLAGFALAAGIRFVTLGSPRARRVTGTALVLASAVPAVILGWLSTVTLVTWWGLGLGLLGAAISALGPYRRSPEDARSETVRAS